MVANERRRVRVRRGLTGQGARPRLLVIVGSIAVLPALAACSGSTNPYHDSLSDFFLASPPPQQAARVPPPPNSSTAAAAQPGFAAASAPATAAPGQPGYAVPPGPATAAAAAPAAAPAAPPSDGVHPSVSLVDLFRSDSTPPERTPDVPHAPSTGTPAGPSGSATAPASPAPDPAASAYPYPQQSLIDIFTKKSDAQ